MTILKLLIATNHNRIQNLECEQARGAGFLWELVGKVVENGWSGEEDAAGLARNLVVNSVSVQTWGEKEYCLGTFTHLVPVGCWIFMGISGEGSGEWLEWWRSGEEDAAGLAGNLVMNSVSVQTWGEKEYCLGTFTHLVPVPPVFDLYEICNFSPCLLSLMNTTSKIGKTKLTQAEFEGQVYEVIKAFYPDVVHLQFQMEECHKMLTDQIDWANPEGDQARIDVSKPLPLSGPSGHALSISKMKAARYLEFGLKLLVPENMCINEVADSSRKVRYLEFGLELLVHEHMWINEVAESSRKVVKIHMHILSVVSIKAFSRYGYDYLKEITLRKADYQEYMIAKKDFKSLYLEDLNLLLLQGFEYKHDNTIIDSPRTVVFHVGNNKRKIMRFNEIYKFSDGTFTNIMEALDFRVKEYKVNRLNPGMNTWFWTKKDVMSFIFSSKWKSVTRCLLIRLTGLIQKVIKPGLINGSEQALSISKMKAARYLEFGLKLLVPEHMWINEVADSSRKVRYLEFGLELLVHEHMWINEVAESSRKVVKIHMHILSVVSIKAFSRYG
nr:hypothetical protein [Tanacetum cinerariifolium]